MSRTAIYWSTSEPHSTNSETMNEFIEEEYIQVGEEIEVIELDGSRAVVRIDGVMYEAHARGDGDWCDYVVELIECGGKL